ncbi:RagB/SusD family nutrient uptake outer membrane protein [Chitinophaga nivalis]|uniref:SusD/RagB family nutrient-binding outer membrane lipoprotein n=1 Tax=Chitinophaga nivalis TaxID=2991709 RepID=A0ABT3IGR2_9BACT|nr:RagB/SusD family nutrient uptake outer membrane protein [Chitinophaga nivalis]MCW3467153.1 SusD/RagB family nutrient-binding outer membrane lipoprotein [Chitinophaga nivalis]MCW3483155.1 SusD/RagB family nutrient-binding outer membrane lipoprotein [Chitinophaga nivalis]
MNHYIKKMLPNKCRVYVAVAALLIGAASCTKNFERYNTDNTGVSNADLKADFNDLGAYLKTAQMAIYNFSGGGDPNSFQVQQNLNADCFSGYMMSATPFNGGRNNLNYFMMTGWNGEAFKVGYLNIMAPLDKLRRNGIDQSFPAVWAVAQIIKVTGMSRVTDIYGPIPYSKAGSSKADIPYDSQEDIYKRFFLELDSANTSLRAQISNGTKLPFDFSQFDLVYNGDFNKWLQFSNSLRLRLAMHISKADRATAKLQAEKAVNPANGGVITENSGNMNVKVTGNGLTNPLVFLAKNWNDISINASLQCYLTGYHDPRTPKYLDKSTDTSFPAQYIGIRIGSITGSNAKDDYKGYSSINYKGGTFTLNTPVQLMTAAEVYFLRAEAALNGWNAGGAVQQLYERGINISLEQWGVPDAAYATNSTFKPDAYVDPKRPANNASAPSDITIRWEDGAAEAKQRERIMTQKWLAMFPEGQEAWTEFRRTGYPRLFPVVNNNSGTTISTNIQIRRLPFPQNEYNTNATEVNNAIKLLGGADNAGTRLWWDRE